VAAKPSQHFSFAVLGAIPQHSVAMLRGGFTLDAGAAPNVFQQKYDLAEFSPTLERSDGR